MTEHERGATATRRSDTWNRVKKGANVILPKVSPLTPHHPTVTLHFVLFPELLYLRRRWSDAEHNRSNASIIISNVIGQIRCFVTRYWTTLYNAHKTSPLDRRSCTSIRTSPRSYRIFLHDPTFIDATVSRATRSYKIEATENEERRILGELFGRGNRVHDTRISLLFPNLSWSKILDNCVQLHK